MKNPTPNTIQKRAIQAIVNIFETGKARPDYAQVTVAAGDRGGISFGRAQFSLTSGSLYLLIRNYASQEDALCAKKLTTYLPFLEKSDSALNDDPAFRNLLRAAGGDPVMHLCQDGLLDRLYWQPACRAALKLGMKDPLAYAVIYDSFIHGSWRRIARAVSEKHGAPEMIGARPWIGAYIAERRRWLADHSNRILRYTAYRMRAFHRMAENGDWALELPIILRGQRIDKHVLAARPPVPVHADDAPPLLRLTAPPIKGEAVALVADALLRAGVRGAGAKRDVFDETLRDAVLLFQRERGLIADGIVGPATRAEMNL